MQTFKTRELLTAIYTPSRSLTDMKVMETTILKFQEGRTSFKKTDYENIWHVASSTKELKKSIENLAIMQFEIPKSNLDKELVFNEILYQNGMILFNFSSSFKNHISPFEGMILPED